MFPLNTWYVACAADEIDEKPLGRTICNQAMVLERLPPRQTARHASR